MKEGFRQSMAWLHTWAGLVVGWLLFAIFATGSSAYFQSEITRWMMPEVAAPPPDRDAAVQNAITWLGRNAAGAGDWSISPASKRDAAATLYWQPPADAPAAARTSARLDGQGREVAARATAGGEFLYRFHFELHYMPWWLGRYLIGIAAMAMLVAIVSGIVTHKKIFADFFLLRIGKGQRSWLDAHNVTGVLVLPFHLMITYTGLVTLATMYMPWGVTANFTTPAAFFEATYPYPEPPARTGVAAPLAPFAPIAAEARRIWGDRDIGYVRVLTPGDRAQRIIVASSSEDGLSARGTQLTFDGTTGRLIGRSPPRGVALQTESVMVGLHMGEYARPVLRWLYFLSGLAGTAMVGSGLVLWTVKRRARLADPARPHLGFRLVETLNIGTIAGVPAAIATYFLANRLLPLGLAERGGREVMAFFAAWAAAMLWAAVRPPRRAWVELLATVAALFALVPVVSALTTGRNLPASLVAGDWVFAGFDLVMLALALMFGWAARKTLHHRAKPLPGRRRAALAEATA